MAYYNCDECSDLLDDDLEPPEEWHKSNGGYDMICPECVLMMEEAIEKAKAEKMSADCKREDYGREYEAEQKAINLCEMREGK